MTLNIIINLLILSVFKYFNFFVASFCKLFGLSNTLAINILLPIGISFYTFQALSYSIDVYRKQIKPTKDVVAFFAYVSFFPQLVAGPIERASHLLPQFEKSRQFKYEEAVEGLRLVLWGMFKKIVIADNCAIFVNQTWNNYDTQHGSTLLIAAVFFAFQIYGDFSGYSDIAIGTARLLGIQLMNNFNLPYFSKTIGEFWRRWHISLSSWLRDYVYIPLGGSRMGETRTITNLLIVFILCGLWHGAAWTFVLWGLYHGLGVVFNRHIKVESSIFVFFFVVIGLILFRAPDVMSAWGYTQAICSPSLFSIPYFKQPLLAIFTAAAITGLMWAEYKNRKPSHWWSIYPLIFMIWWFSQQSNQFIYFQF